MEKISFELFGLTLLEPLSTLMNWVLAWQCAYYVYRLKGKSEDSQFLKYWAWFFFAYAISLFFGGFSHLLYHYTGLYGKIPGWAFAVLGATFGELAMASGVKVQGQKRLLLIVIRAKLAAVVVMQLYHFSFTWVMVHTAGMVFIVGVIGTVRWRAGLPGYRFFLYGIGCLVLMAGIKGAEIDLHPAWLNRDDLAHGLMLVAYYCYFRAVSSAADA